VCNKEDLWTQCKSPINSGATTSNAAVLTSKQLKEALPISEKNYKYI
jgi:hypothetical protein